MSSASLTRTGRDARSPGTAADGPPPRGGAAARPACPGRGSRWRCSSVVTTVGFLVYPTFPNYDSYYSLLWGRELLDGELPSFDAYRAPTQHPLAIALRRALSLLGDAADRVMVGATLVSFVALVAGLYRLARASFTPLAGLVAAALLCTRFDFPFLAARGYIDIPYLAFVVWAAALDAAQPRRGDPRAPAARRGRADAPRGVAAERPVLAVAGVGGPLACGQRVRSAAARRRRAARLGRDGLDRHRRPAVLADPHERARRGARPPARPEARCPRRLDLPHQARQVPGLLRRAGRPRARRRADARGASDVPPRCSPPAWRRSRSSASPACRSSTATCSCRR